MDEKNDVPMIPVYQAEKLSCISIITISITEYMK